MKHTLAISLGTLALAASSIGFATSQALPTAAVTPDPRASSLPDEAFVRAVLRSNDGEIAGARYVLRFTKNAMVRTFAEEMVADHSTADVKLQSTARNAHVRIPERERPGRVAPLLGDVVEPQLDVAYMRQQVDAHREALAVLVPYSTNGKSPELRTYAGDVAPVVQAHFAKAQTLLASLPAQPNAAASVAPIAPGGVPVNQNPTGGNAVPPPSSPTPASSGSPNPQPSTGVPEKPSPAASTSAVPSTSPKP